MDLNDGSSRLPRREISIASFPHPRTRCVYDSASNQHDALNLLKGLGVLLDETEDLRRPVREPDRGFGWPRQEPGSSGMVGSMMPPGQRPGRGAACAGGDSDGPSPSPLGLERAEIKAARVKPAFASSKNRMFDE